MEKAFEVKLLGSKVTKRILYLECGKDFFDFLVSLIHVPVGQLAKILLDNEAVSSNENCLGSLSHFYDSISKLPESSFSSSKEETLNPVINYHMKKVFYLEGCPSGDDFQTVYVCPYHYNASYYCKSFALNYNEKCSSCSYGMSTPLKNTSRSSKKFSEGFMKDNTVITVTDSLVVFVSSTIKTIELLNSKSEKLTDLVGVTVNVNKTKALEIIKAASSSTTVLNNVFQKEFLKEIS